MYALNPMSITLLETGQSLEHGLPSKPETPAGEKKIQIHENNSLRSEGNMDKIFEGIRIVDLGMVHAGVASGYMLGDLGAEVIKIEEPVRGDSSRGMTTVFGAHMSVKGRPVLPELSNRNKKSITLDLKKEEGREILYKLVEKSDVFVTNFHPSVLEGLGLQHLHP